MPSYSRSRSRSRSPPRRRERSRSPPQHRETRNRSPRRDRDDRHGRRSTGGFRWKEKRRDDDRKDDERGNDRGSHRGHRDRDHELDRYQDRGQDRRRDSEKVRRHSPSPGRRDSFRERGQKVEKPKEEKKPRIAAPTEPMIVVKVNDRLGTTTNVPCLGSDTIGDFKKLVAAMIGRDVSRIKLMRQSERPFRDHITLADYEISNGVQLDLELDTGG